MGCGYDFDFKKEDAVRWLKNSIKNGVSLQKTIDSEIPESQNKEKYDAAFGFFCRVNFLAFSEETQDMDLNNGH